MKNITTLFTTIFLFTSSLFAGPGNYNWVFGNNNWISFQPDGKSVNVYDSSQIAYSDAEHHTSGVSSISDRDGNLLFYTTGRDIWNRKHKKMNNSGGLIQNAVSQRHTLIVKKPGDNPLYYIFHGMQRPIEDPVYFDLSYTIVDMSLDEGYGGIAGGGSNILVKENMSGTVVGAFHQNMESLWIVVYERNRFFAYLLTEDGLNDTPVISPTEFYAEYDSRNYYGDFLKFSPNGKILAARALWSNRETNDTIYFHEFNTSTGNIYPMYNIVLEDNALYYADEENGSFEFSPDSKKFYCFYDRDTLYYDSLYIAQYDLSSGKESDIRASEYLIQTPTIHNDWAYDMLLGPDEKIYISYTYHGAYRKSNYLDRINFPDEKGENCSYEQYAVNLNLGEPVRNIQGYLPNMLPLYFDWVEVEIKNIKTYCVGDSIILTHRPYSAESVEWYLPNGEMASTEDTLIIENAQLSDAGIYKLILEYEPGKVDSAFTEVKVYEKPPAKIIGSKKFCKHSVHTLKAGPINENYTYYWSTGDESTEIEIGHPDTYYLTITNENGCDSTVMIEVEYYPYTEVELQGEDYICKGDTSVFSVEPRVPGSSYLWSTGETTPEIQVHAYQKYSVTVTDSNGCEALLEKWLRFKPWPDVEIICDVDKCDADSAILSVEPQRDDYSYLWSTGETLPEIIVYKEGNYSVTVTNNSSLCTNTVDKDIIFSGRPEAQIVPSGALCEGDSVLLTAMPYEAENTYLWSTGEATKGIYVTEPGEYSVTVTNKIGCDSTTSIILEEKYVPELTISGDSVICGSEAVLEILDYDEENRYVWSTGDSSKSITVTEAAIYYATAISKDGCETTKEFEVKMGENPEFEIEGDFYVCEGEGTTISVKTDEENCTYLWSTGKTDDNITIGSAGEYSITVTNQFGCDSTALFEIFFYDKPLGEITGDIVICKNGEITLTVEPYDAANLYQWSNGDEGQTSTIDKPGEYSLIITNENGCKSYDTIDVRLFEYELETDIEKIESLCSDSDTTFTITISNNGDEEIIIGGIAVQNYNDNFSIESSSPPWTIGTNDNIELQMKFSPSFTGKYYDILLLDMIEPCSEQLSYNLNITVLPDIFIWADTIQAGIGDKASIDIKASLADGNDETVSMSNCIIEAKIKADLFIPEADENVDSYLIDDLYRQYDIQIQDVEISKHPSIIYSIKGLVLLSDSKGDILIDYSCTEDKYCIETANGYIITKPICNQHLRSVEGFSKTFLEVAPNPVSGTLTANIRTEETGAFKLSLYNIHGNEIKSISWMKSNESYEEFIREIELTNISSGCYYLILWSPWYSLSEQVLICE